MKIKKEKTPRGFSIIKFEDLYGTKCSIQKSSLATEDAILIGIDDANPQILASKTQQGGTGWVPYDVPEDVLLCTKMHLTVKHVKQLLPILKFFAEIGELPS